MRIYVTPKSKIEQELLEVLRSYGMAPVRAADKDGTYYDVTPPKYWLSNRRTVFRRAIHRFGPR